MHLDSKYLAFWLNAKHVYKSARFPGAHGSDWVLTLVMAPRTHFISVSLTVGYMGQG